MLALQASARAGVDLKVTPPICVVMGSKDGKMEGDWNGGCNPRRNECGEADVFAAEPSRPQLFK